MSKTMSGLIFVLAWALALVGNAAAERKGFYGSLDLGIAIPEDVETLASDSDVPTNCDQHFSPITVKGIQLPLPLSDSNCARGQDIWQNVFDLENGILGGVSFGYAWQGFRGEAEYFHRGHSGEYSPLEIQSGGKDDEFVVAGERISDLRAHHFFANLYYDFQRLLWPRVIPYVGAGVGAARVKMNYSGKFQRNADQSVISGLGRHPEAAGTLTFSEAELSDTLWAWQWMVGLDYALTERFSVGAKGRYAAVFGGDFKDGHLWDRLRSHASTIGPNGDTVAYDVELDNGLDLWGISLNIKYFF